MNHGEYDNRLDEEFLEDADSRPIAQRTLANNSLEGATSFCNALGVLPWSGSSFQHRGWRNKSKSVSQCEKWLPSSSHTIAIEV